jgi:hydroxymethylpyrimidine pyrophosphatase-like HAD family hydrolase
MRYRAVATDFDGTLACHGVVDAPTIAAVEEAKAAGVRMLLVTGRELPSLFATFDRTDLFDIIVAENGGVLYTPSSGRAEPIAPAPPPDFVAKLEERRVPLSVGHCIVATTEPHDQVVIDVLRDMALNWHLVYNKGAVMVLPPGVTKASGLAQALPRLGLTASEVIAIGDAENDHAFLQACGLGVAVANALDALKAHADVVTRGARGAGVRELLGMLLQGGLAAANPGGD